MSRVATKNHPEGTEAGPVVTDGVTSSTIPAETKADAPAAAESTPSKPVGSRPEASNSTPSKRGSFMDRVKGTPESTKTSGAASGTDSQKKRRSFFGRIKDKLTKCGCWFSRAWQKTKIRNEERKLDARLEKARVTAEKARSDSKDNLLNDVGPLGAAPPVASGRRSPRGSLYHPSEHPTGIAGPSDPTIHDKPALPPRSPARGNPVHVATRSAQRVSDGNVGGPSHPSNIARPSPTDDPAPNPGHDALDAVRDLSMSHKNVGSPAAARRASERNDVPDRLPPRKVFPDCVMRLFS